MGRQSVALPRSYGNIDYQLSMHWVHITTTVVVHGNVNSMLLYLRKSILVKIKSLTSFSSSVPWLSGSHNVESFAVATMTFLTVTEHLCHKWPRIYSACRKHFRSFPHSWWLITAFVTRVTRRMTLVDQELLILPEHLSSPPVFSGIGVTRSLLLCAMFCRSLFVLLSFFFWPLCCLSFYLRILI